MTNTEKIQGNSSDPHFGTFIYEQSNRHLVKQEFKEFLNNEI